MKTHDENRPDAPPHIQVSEDEARAGSLSPQNIALAELLLVCRGYVVLRGAIPGPLLGLLAAAFRRIYEDCVSAGAAAGGRIWPPRLSPREQATYHCTGGRWRIQPRLVGPMSAPALLANPLVLAVLRSRLGRRLHCRYVSSDTCAPGAVIQAPHSDVDTRAVRGGKPPGYVMNVAVHECGLHNGPLEVWPGGSHLWPPDVLRKRGLEDIMIQDARNARAEDLARHITSERLTLHAGDVLLRDPAMWHRGTPNPSAEPRTMLTVGYFCDDYFYTFGDTGHDHEAFQAMSPEVQRLLSYRFDLGNPLFWRARRCPWPGSARLPLREAAALSMSWHLTRLRGVAGAAA